MNQVRYHKFLFCIAMYLVEEFFYASLDVKSFDWALMFLKIISKKFP